MKRLLIKKSLELKRYKMAYCRAIRINLHNVGVGVFNCQQILTKISLDIFNVMVKNKSNVV